MALGKTVQGERGERADDLLDGIRSDGVGGQAGPQLPFHPAEPLGRAREADRPAQLVGLRGGEPAQFHRDPQDLLLKKHHAQGALKDGTGALIHVPHGLAPGAAREVRMNGPAMDRPRPDDAHLDGEVVEVLRLHPR